MKWGGKQRIMRGLKLTKKDLGKVKHPYALKQRALQLIIFQPGDFPPFYEPDLSQVNIYSPNRKLETLTCTVDELK